MDLFDARGQSIHFGIAAHTLREGRKMQEEWEGKENRGNWGVSESDVPLKGLPSREVS